MITVNTPLYLLNRIKAIRPSLPRAQAKLAEFIIENFSEISDLSVTELASLAGVSEGTIVKFCQSLGCQGYSDFRLRAAEEAAITVPDLFYQVTEEDSLEGIAAKVFRSNITSLEETLRSLDFNELSRCVEAIKTARRIEFYAVGSSAFVAGEAALKLSKLGYTCIFRNDPHNQAMFAAHLGTNDLAVGVSRSGRTLDTINSLRIAREAGAVTACLTNYSAAPILAVSDIKLITSSYDKSFHAEPMASMLSHFSIIQCLFLALAMEDKALEYLKKTQLATEDKHC
ncbi:MAG: MurR/RpiR family transcriptional regulator [Firmicutes bacterium]|nr:MurR/RpiR family transcriptional regulator [Bacillota bacterium]